MADDKKFSPENMHEILKNIQGATGKAHFTSTPDVQTKVQIFPDKTIGPGKFRPHPLVPGSFKAHPQTIAAVRKDIFLGGEDFVDLEEIIECEGCKESIDKQFWAFCPFCGAEYR